MFDDTTNSFYDLTHFANTGVQNCKKCFYDVILESGFEIHVYSEYSVRLRFESQYFLTKY